MEFPRGRRYGQFLFGFTKSFTVVFGKYRPAPHPSSLLCDTELPFAGMYGRKPYTPNLEQIKFETDIGLPKMAFMV